MGPQWATHPKGCCRQSHIKKPFRFPSKYSAGGIAGLHSSIENRPSAIAMCPSVWLTLDILAGRKDANGGQSATGISQHIGSWLDNLKANRSGRMDGGGSGDEYQNNVHFALELNNAGSGGGGVAAVEPPNLDFNGEEVPVNNKRRKKKKGIRKETLRGKKKAAREALAMVEEEVKPLVDCR